MPDDKTTMDAYDTAQEMIVDGTDPDEIEMYLVKNYPDVNAQGLIPTVLRRAYKDLSRL